MSQLVMGTNGQRADPSVLLRSRIHPVTHADGMTDETRRMLDDLEAVEYIPEGHREVRAEAPSGMFDQFRRFEHDPRRGLEDTLSHDPLPAWDPRGDTPSGITDDSRRMLETMRRNGYIGDGPVGSTVGGGHTAMGAPDWVPGHHGQPHVPARPTLEWVVPGGRPVGGGSGALSSLVKSVGGVSGLRKFVRGPGR